MSGTSVRNFVSVGRRVIGQGSSRQSVSMDDDLVTLMHGKTQWSMRASTLQNCSPVLDSMLRDSDDKQPRIIDMNDVLESNVEAFLQLARIASYDSRKDFPSVAALSKLTADAMPLVHKYDCKGLLQMLKSVQNQKPDVKGIMSVVKYETDSIDWVSDSVKMCILNDVFKLAYTTNKTACEARMAEIPHSLLSKLFTYTMFDLQPTGKDPWGRDQPKQTSFRDLLRNQ